MAGAYPEFTAGEGDIIGRSGSSSEWPYIVELDNEGEDPWDVLFAVAALGTAHPDPQLRSSMFATDYRKGERLNEVTWRIWVLYSPLSDSTIGQWRRGGRFGHETRRLDWSLAHFDSNGRVLDASIQVGPSKFAFPNPLATPPEPWTGDYKTASGQDINRVLAIDSSAGGIEVNDALLPLNYEITVPQLTIGKILQVMSYRWHTNSQDWPFKTARNANTYKKWSLIFSGFAFEDRVINLASAGPIWFSDVQIELLYKPLEEFLNPYGWRGTRQFEHFTDDQGYRHEVIERFGNTERRARKDYVVYQEASFYSLFNLFGANPVT